MEKRARGCLRPEHTPASATAHFLLSAAAALPPAVDYTSMMLPVRDQGASDKCVAYALAAMKEYQDQPGVHLDVDSVYSLRANAPAPGMVTVNGLDILQTHGIGPNPANHRIASYESAFRGRSVYNVKAALAERGVLVASLPCDPDEPQGRFWRAGGNEGHAVALVGYDDARGAFRLRNSWGADYGNNGYAWIPYDEFAVYAWEAWSAKDADGAVNVEQKKACCACV
jgi:C1A family cysteine protease